MLQDAIVIDPVVLLVHPIGHGEHDNEPLSGEKNPTGQSVQLADPGVE